MIELDFVAIRGGVTAMGSEVHEPEEAPVRSVRVEGFELARTPVTNDQFAAFVEATGYRTVAERPLDPADFPGAPVENLEPGSLVFTMTPGPVDLTHLSQWWTWTPGASWAHPEGPSSDLEGRGDHPVTQVAAEDAEAFCAWAGAVLPTEAEWEFAARGGLEGAPYTWGASPEGAGERLANFWHGQFPFQVEAGYGTTSVPGTYPANGYGLFDMAGNVWEWTADYYATTRFAGTSTCCTVEAPRGVSPEESLDPRQPQFAIPRRVVKGGSFLCADSYCRRYRPAARRPQMVDTAMSHLGFRVARRQG